MTVKNIKPETEEVLLGLIKGGDYAAFRALYDLHFDTLYGTAYNIVREHSDAKDIIQDIFVWFWENREQWNLTSCKGYLLTAVKFKTASYFRANKSKEDFYKKMEIRQPAVVDESMELEVRQLRQLIEQITSELPARCQEIFRLSRFDQLSNKEIAVQLHISEKTVEAQITIALKKLREKLGRSNFIMFFFI